MADYGIPYQGSKDKIIHKIAAMLPEAENFYDLFGGGFSVTHWMLFHSKKYKHFHYNEIEADTVDLIKRAIAGKYSYKVFKPKWISREDFAKNKAKCAYTRIIWSFGNNQKGYLFGKTVEEDKRSLHNVVVFDEWDDRAKEILGVDKLPPHLSIRGRRLACRNLVRLQGDQVLSERLEQLEQLERLQRLERLERLERLSLSSLSYDEVTIKRNSVIYCDPPYANTAGYTRDFDHKKFWEWVRKNRHPVFVSEYTAPPDMKTVMAIRHKKSNSQTITDSVEKLFANKAAIALIGKLRTKNNK